MKQKLAELKGEIEKFRNVVGNFNTPLSLTDIIVLRKINGDIEATLNQVDLINISRTLCPSAEEDTFSYLSI